MYGLILAEPKNGVNVELIILTTKTFYGVQCDMHATHTRFAHILHVLHIEVTLGSFFFVSFSFITLAEICFFVEYSAIQLCANALLSLRDYQKVWRMLFFIGTFECYLGEERKNLLESTGNDFFHLSVLCNISGCIVQLKMCVMVEKVDFIDKNECTC